MTYQGKEDPVVELNRILDGCKDKFDKIKKIFDELPVYFKVSVDEIKCDYTLIHNTNMSTNEKLPAVKVTYYLDNLLLVNAQYICAFVKFLESYQDIKNIIIITPSNSRKVQRPDKISNYNATELNKLSKMNLNNKTTNNTVINNNLNSNNVINSNNTVNNYYIQTIKIDMSGINSIMRDKNKHLLNHTYLKSNDNISHLYKKLHKESPYLCCAESTAKILKDMQA